MKRKMIILSCLVFCIIVNLAKAAGLWCDYAATIPVLELQYGKYDKWPIEEKRGFLSVLVENGFILLEDSITSDSILELCENQIDCYISQWLQVKEEDINFLDILEAAWGAFDEWSDEQRMWYSHVEAAAGIAQEDKTVFGIPTGELLTKEHAIQIASDAFSEAFSLTEEQFRGYSITTQFQSKTEDGSEDQWYVYFENTINQEVPIQRIEVYVDASTGFVETDFQVYVKALALKNMTK